MTTTSVLSTVLTAIGSIVTESVDWITSFMGAVTGNDLLLLFVIFGFVGTGIGLIRRLIRL